ncbi:MAG TPA: hypothetical protein VMH61_04295 [Candidatus Acidoferrales bacterium]|nr:hypothetical protein [Candidatus Acidoferrales bacterium]
MIEALREAGASLRRTPAWLEAPLPALPDVRLDADEGEGPCSPRGALQRRFASSARSSR